MHYSINQEEATLEIFDAQGWGFYVFFSVLSLGIFILGFIELSLSLIEVNLGSMPRAFWEPLVMGLIFTSKALLMDTIQLKLNLKSREVLILRESLVRKRYESIPFEKICEINWGFIDKYTLELFILLDHGEKLIIYSECAGRRTRPYIDCSQLPEIIHKLNACIQQCKETLSASCSPTDKEQSTLEKLFLRLDKNTLY
jgi:hypothetical protein